MTFSATTDEQDDFVELPGGRIRFTDEGLAYYRSYFGYAGIDIRSINTLEDLNRARRQAFPYFFAFMEERLGKQTQTIEIRSLLAIVRGDWPAYERAKRQFATRDRLSVIVSSRGEQTARS